MSQITHIFSHLKLWIAVARQNLKWLKILIEYLSAQGVKTLVADSEGCEGRTDQLPYGPMSDILRAIKVRVLSGRTNFRPPPKKYLFCIRH